MSSKEIKIALFQMCPEKNPGPDGFDTTFYQKQRHFIGKDIISTVQSFFVSAKLLKEVNYTFLTLIHKVSNSSDLADLRPISCCNVLYNKTLGNELISELITPHQSAFLKGRKIRDCSLLAHELIQEEDSPQRLLHED